MGSARALWSSRFSKRGGDASGTEPALHPRPARGGDTGRCGKRGPSWEKGKEAWLGIGGGDGQAAPAHRARVVGHWMEKASSAPSPERQQ